MSEVKRYEPMTREELIRRGENPNGPGEVHLHGTALHYLDLYEQEKARAEKAHAVLLRIARMGAPGASYIAQQFLAADENPAPPKEK